MAAPIPNATGLYRPTTITASQPTPVPKTNAPASNPLSWGASAGTLADGTQIVHTPWGTAPAGSAWEYGFNPHSAALQATPQGAQQVSINPQWKPDKSTQFGQTVEGYLNDGQKNVNGVANTYEFGGANPGQNANAATWLAHQMSQKYGTPYSVTDENGNFQVWDGQAPAWAQWQDQYMPNNEGQIYNTRSARDMIQQITPMQHATPPANYRGFTRPSINIHQLMAQLAQLQLQSPWLLHSQQ